MGFISDLRRFGKGIVSGARKVGDFVENKVKPVVGQVAGGVRKVAHFVNTNDTVNSILDTVAGIDPRAAKVVQAGRTLSQGLERGAELVQSGLSLSDNLNNVVKNRDLGGAKNLISDGRMFVENAKAFRQGKADPNEVSLPNIKPVFLRPVKNK